MRELYSPKSAVEFAFIKSILDAERIDYYVRNDNFGSLEAGPIIQPFNQKTIIVHESHYARARELVQDYLDRAGSGESMVKENTVISDKREMSYSFSDRVRRLMESLLFGSKIPVRKSRTGKKP